MASIEIVPGNNMQRIIQIGAFVVLLLTAPGCLYCIGGLHPKDVAVSVRDAESGAAIAGAQVTFVYTMDGIPCPKPDDRSAQTDAAGKAALNVDFNLGYWRIEADGYVARLRTPTIAEPSSDNMAVELLRSQVTVRIPPGFSGLLTVTVHPVDGSPANSSDQPAFQVTADQSGQVTVEVPSAVMRWRSMAPGRDGLARWWFTAVDTSGRALPSMMWHMGSTDEMAVIGPLTGRLDYARQSDVEKLATEVYFIGTRRAFNQLRKQEAGN